MTKGQLPKAYLRIDPNLDQTHPDPGSFMRLLCAAARQPHRGRFSSKTLLVGILGKTVAHRLIERGDVVAIEDARWYVPGWDEWQEGDWTVGDRQQRIRDRRGSQPLHDRDASVTRPLENSYSPPIGSKAARQQGNETVGGTSLKENPVIAALHARGWNRVSPKQRDLIWEVVDRHSYEWVADIIKSTPTSADPISAVLTADREWQDTRSSEIDRQEREWQAEKANDRRTTAEWAKTAN